MDSLVAPHVCHESGCFTDTYRRQVTVLGDGREQVHLEDIRSYIAGEMPQHFLQHRMDHFFRTLGKEWSRMMDCVPNVVPAEASRFARCSLSWLTLAHHKPKVRYEHVED